MGIPELADRLKTAPAQVLRAVFSGIGRIVLDAEKSQDPSSGRDRTETSRPGSTTAKDCPATAKDRPATGKDRPATGKDRPAAGKDRPASGKDRPAKGTKGQVSKHGQDHKQQPAGRSRQRGASPEPTPSSRWRSLDTTGNVRLLSAEDLDDGSAEAQGQLRAEPGAAANSPAADISAAQTPAGQTTAAEPPAATARAATEPPAADAPAADAPAAEPPAAEPTAAEPTAAEPPAADAPAADAPAAEPPAAEPPAAEPTAAEPPAAEPTLDGPAAADHDAAAALPLPGYDGLSLPSIRARLRNIDADQLAVLAAYERTHAARPDVLGMLERRIEKLETGR